MDDLLNALKEEQKKEKFAMMSLQETIDWCMKRAAIEKVNKWISYSLLVSGSDMLMFI